MIVRICFAAPAHSSSRSFYPKQRISSFEGLQKVKPGIGKSLRSILGFKFEELVTKNRGRRPSFVKSTTEGRQGRNIFDEIVTSQAAHRGVFWVYSVQNSEEPCEHCKIQHLCFNIVVTRF